MKSILLPMAISFGLVAQTPHYEQGTLVTRVEGKWRYMGGIARQEYQLLLQEPGNEVRRIAPPGDLGQHRGYVETYGRWQGTSYALAVLSHPLFTRIRDAWNPKDHTNRRDYLPRVLYRSRDGQTWEQIATHRRDPYCQFWNFIPLEDGRFLVDRAIRLFEKDGAASPFAIYGIDGQGRLVLDELVPMAEAGRGWIPVRTECGITLMNRSTGKWILLSNRNGQILREGTLWTGTVGAPSTTWKILHAAPRRDGCVVIATEIVPADSQSHPGQKLQLFKNNPRLGPAERLVVAHLQWKLREAPITPVAVQWWLLEPATGVVNGMDPPTNIPNIATAMARYGFRFTVLPSGDLAFGLGMQSLAPPVHGILAWNPFPLAELQRLLMPRPKQAQR